MIAFWAPSFLFAIMFFGVGSLALWGENPVSWWLAQNTSSQTLFALAFLLVVTVGAYVLQSFASPLIRWYEGYWPAWMLFLIRWGQVTMRKMLESTAGRVAADGSLKTEATSLSAEDQLSRQMAFGRYVSFPQDEGRVRPTRLGNVLTAAEEYAFELYNLDTVLWWPRLVPLLPDTLRSQIDATLTPLFALLNLSTIFMVLCLATLLLGILTFNVVIFCFGGLTYLVLSRMCYVAAVMQASDYGQQIRVAFDLYRFSVLKQMRLPVPKTQAEEAALWDSLNKWIYQYQPPSETGWPPDVSNLAGSFQYVSEAEPPNVEPVRIEIIVKYEK